MTLFNFAPYIFPHKKIENTSICDGDGGYSNVFRIFVPVPIQSHHGK